MDNNVELKYQYLQILCKSYSSGQFEPLFPLLSDDVVFQSQWVFEALEGRKKVEDYLTGKGQTMRKYNACPQCEIVELQSYQEGELAMYMCKQLEDKENGVLVLVELNNKKIQIIDLCMPGLFSFIPFQV